MAFLARTGEEDKLPQFVSAWESTFPRKPPPMLVEWASHDGEVSFGLMG